MFIRKFMESLLPRLGKDRILEDIKITLQELETLVVPAVDQASDYLNTHKPKSDGNKALETLFYRTYKPRGRKGVAIFHDVRKVLPDLIKNLRTVEGMIEDIFEREVINEGLTAKKASLIRTAEAISFTSNYTLDLLNLYYVNEASEAGAEVKESMSLAPVVVRNIESRIGRYAMTLNKWAIKPADFLRIVGKIPDVIIASNNEEALKANYTEKDLDPFGSPLMQGFVGNPIYHIRLNIAEWQTRRYKSNKDKKKVLELQLLHLEYLNQGKNDPKLEKEIQYVQSRIEKTDRKIREAEESVGGF